MRYLHWLLIVLLGLCTGWMAVSAQEVGDTPSPEEFVASFITPNIGDLVKMQAPKEVQVGRNVIFRINDWEGIPPALRDTLVLEWDLGDGQRKTGQEVVHTYQSPGQYTITLIASSDGVVYEQRQEIFVYEQMYVVLLDSDWSVFTDPLLDTARDKAIFLAFIDLHSPSLLATSGSDPAVVLERYKLQLQEASLIFTGEDGRQALSALSSFKKTNPDFDFGTKRIIVSSASNMFIFQRIASRSLSSINAQDLILSEQDLLSVLYGLITAPDQESFLVTFLASHGVQVLDKQKETPGLTNFISYYINEAISRGIPGDLFLFILLLPIIVTTISFFRQVVGLDTLGIFMPSVLTLSFVILGLKSALIILLVIVLINLLTRTVLKHFYLSYAPKMSIVVSVSALAMLAMIIIGVYFDVTFGIDVSQSSRAVLSIFPLVIMAMLAEQIMNIQINKGPRSALRILSEMIFTCVLTYGLVSMEATKMFTFAFPEIVVVLTIVIDLALGRFTGLRLMEYLRFRDLFFHETEE